MKLLFVIDMQNDFIDGVLGSAKAQAIVPKVVKKIKNEKGLIIATYDTHYDDYLMKTEEGKHLPIPHCLYLTHGWALNKEVHEALSLRETTSYCLKSSFGHLWDFNKKSVEGVTEIEIIGLDTDFCVLANAMTLKAAFPNVPITIDAACCAGSTPEWHEKALDMLEHCHFNVINRKKE